MTDQLEWTCRFNRCMLVLIAQRWPRCGPIPTEPVTRKLD
jgi:hypothetical protein